WNSAYPYVVGPTFYGTVNGGKVNSINENVKEYSPTTGGVSKGLEAEQVLVYPNPAGDMVAIQLPASDRISYTLTLYDLHGAQQQQTTLWQGSTMAYFDTRLLYPGEYFVKISGGDRLITKKISVLHP